MANFLIYTRIFSNVGREKGSNVKVPHLALQGVSKVFVLIENVRVCKIWDKHRSLSKHTTNKYKLLTHTLQATCGTLLTYENKLRTHTLQSKVRYFHVTPLAPHYFDLSSYLKC